MTAVEEFVARKNQLEQEYFAYFFAELRLTAPIRMIVDIGAHEGNVTRMFHDAFGEAAIHAIEPDPETYGRLAGGINGQPNVRTHNMGIGARSGRTRLHRTAESMCCSFLPPVQKQPAFLKPGLLEPIGTVDVPMMTLAEFCWRESIEVIDLLKTDTQGYELEVLRGAGDMLQPDRIRGIMVEINFCQQYVGQASAGAILDMLIGAGYSIFTWRGIHYQRSGRWAWADALLL